MKETSYIIKGKFFPLFRKIRLEIRQNIMRFAHHPSLALMGINNDMDNVQLVLPNELTKDINRREKKYRQAFGKITNFEFNALTIKDINSSLLFTTSLPSGLARQHVESPYIKLPNLNFTNGMCVCKVYFSGSP